MFAYDLDYGYFGIKYNGGIAEILPTNAQSSITTDVTTASLLCHNRQREELWRP